MRAIRYLFRLTQYDIAKALKVSVCTVIQWEKGRDNPNKKHAVELVQFYINKCSEFEYNPIIVEAVNDLSNKLIGESVLVDNFKGDKKCNLIKYLVLKNNLSVPRFVKKVGICRGTYNLWMQNTDNISPRFYGVLNDVLKGYKFEDDPQMNFSNQIIRLRRSLGLRQRDAAKLLGVSHTQLSFWENGFINEKQFEKVTSELTNWGDRMGGLIKDLSKL